MESLNSFLVSPFIRFTEIYSKINTENLIICIFKMAIKEAKNYILFRISFKTFADF